MIKWIGLFIATALAISYFYIEDYRAVATMRKTKPPNIVFILADDLNEALYVQDEKLSSLLNKNGINFSNFFVSLPLCCPSRVTTLRGQFAHNTTISTNQKISGGGFEGMYLKGLEQSTVAVWLQNAGYRTALIGKYLNGYPNDAPTENYIPPGWNTFISPNRGYFQSQYNYSLNENGVTVSYGQKPEEHLNDVLMEKSVAFIKDCKKNFNDQPFFMYVASHAPHKPATPPLRYLDRYKDQKAPRSSSFNEEDVSDKPLWVQNKNLLTNQQISDIDELYAMRRASLLALADLVETVIKTLEEEDLSNTTYLFFSSDNGFHQGQHRLNSGKTTPYEEDINVPLVVIGPNIPRGKTIDALVANVDYAPTFADIAGIKTPDFVDGRSFFGFLRGTPPSSWRKALLLENSGPEAITPPSNNPLLEVQDPFDIDLLDNAKFTIPAYAGLRMLEEPTTNRGPATYTHYVTDEKELYFLNDDPLQNNNRYQSASDETKHLLQRWVDSLKTAKGEKLREIEENPPR